MICCLQAAQFDEWKNVIKLELDSKCARIVAIEKELNEEKENNKIMMGSGNHDLLQVPLLTCSNCGARCPCLI